jgi:hypothetical protein
MTLLQTGDQWPLEAAIWHHTRHLPMRRAAVLGDSQHLGSGEVLPSEPWCRSWFEVVTELRPRSRLWLNVACDLRARSARWLEFANELEPGLLVFLRRPSLRASVRGGFLVSKRRFESDDRKRCSDLPFDCSYISFGRRRKDAPSCLARSTLRSPNFSALRRTRWVASRSPRASPPTTFTSSRASKLRSRWPNSYVT